MSSGKTSENETPDTRGECHIVACLRTKIQKNICVDRLRHNALWLIGHPKGERGHWGGGNARKHNQPCVVEATHLREEQQEDIVSFRNEGCTLGAFCERDAPVPRSRNVFFYGLAMKL